MSNETVIVDGQQQILDQVAQLQVELETYLDLLQNVADLSMSISTPTLGYSESIAAIAAFTTALTANFSSGLAYPSMATIIADSKTDGYDSAFLLYLETTLKTKPTAAWVASIRAIQATYTAQTTAAAQSFVSSILPVLSNGNTFAASMTEQVNDIADMETVDSTLLWAATAQDLLLSYQQEAINGGLSIEEIRAAIVNDMIAVHNDYNQAILNLAKTDFQALNETVRQMRIQISSQIDASSTDSDETFARVRLANRVHVLELDTDLARIKDEIRRTATDYQLQLGRGVAFVDYVNSALSQAVISGTMHGSYTSSSEV